MKRQFLILALIFSLFVSNVIAQTVYITKTGAKYHTEGCRYLSHSSFAISLSDAINRGYGSCSICRPPTTTSYSSNQIAKPHSYSSLQSTSSTSVQCSGTTKSGARCKHMTRSSNGRCWQHGG